LRSVRHKGKGEFDILDKQGSREANRGGEEVIFQRERLKAEGEGCSLLNINQPISGRKLAPVLPRQGARCGQRPAVLRRPLLRPGAGPVHGDRSGAVERGQPALDLFFLGVDVLKLGHAIYRGHGVKDAAIDVGLSLAGVLSPVPGSGQVLKAGRVVGKAESGAKAADNAWDAMRGGAAGAKADTRAEAKGGKHVLLDPSANVARCGQTCDLARRERDRGDGTGCSGRSSGVAAGRSCDVRDRTYVVRLVGL
jgi:hypothetical protein